MKTPLRPRKLSNITIGEGLGTIERTIGSDDLDRFRRLFPTGPWGPSPREWVPLPLTLEPFALVARNYAPSPAALARHVFAWSACVKGGEDVCIAGDIADAYVRRGAEYLAIRATTTSNEIALGSNVSTLALSPDLGRQKSASQLVADSVSVETQSKNEPFAADPDVECLARATFDPSEIDVDGFTDHADNVHTNPSIAQGYGVSKPIVPGLMMLAYTVPVLGQVDGATSLRSGDIDLRFLAPVAVGTSLEVEISGHRDPESLRYDGKELKITIHTLDRKLVSIGSAHLDGTTRITEESDMRRK